MNWLKQNYLNIIGAVSGSILGYVYWLTTYCNSEACAINSTPFPLMINFAILGALTLSILKSFFTKNKPNTHGKN